MPKRSIPALILLLICLLWTTTALADKAPANDVSKAQFFLKKLEDQAAKAKGQPFKTQLRRPTGPDKDQGSQGKVSGRPGRGRLVSAGPGRP